MRACKLTGLRCSTDGKMNQSLTVVRKKEKATTFLELKYLRNAESIRTNVGFLFTAWEQTVQPTTLKARAAD